MLFRLKTYNMPIGIKLLNFLFLIKLIAKTFPYYRFIICENEK